MNVKCQYRYNNNKLFDQTGALLYLVLGVLRQRNIVPPLERGKVEAIKKDITGY